VNRVCYRHPLDPTKCIKVDVRKRGGPTEKEAHYYKKLARIRPLMSYTYVSRFYGFVETNQGRGGVFDLVMDEGTLTISKTFLYYIHKGVASAHEPVWIKAHRDFLDSILRDAIIIRDLIPGNLCARRMLDGSYQFVSIDGIGHRDFIPLCDYFRSIARRKQLRHIKRKGFETLESTFNRLEGKGEIEPEF